jgi:hypothetical protein
MNGDLKYDKMNIELRPNTGSPLSHSLMEKNEKERLKTKQYFHGFKLKHVWIKKSTGLGVTDLC